MPKICFNSAFDGTNYALLKDDADQARMNEGTFIAWEFDTREEDTLSLIRAEDGTMDFNLRRDQNGLFNPNTYRIAYTISYARAHITSYSKAGVHISEPTEAQIGALPLDILTAYLRKTRTGLNWEKVLKEEAVKKEAVKAEDAKKEEPVNPDKEANPD